jgi:hypothetical protein
MAELRKEWPVLHAKSKPADVGVAYPYRLQTHCGVDWYVDFDGSFWNAVGESRAIKNGDYRNLGNPSDRGTMTLESQESLLYESNRGIRISYRRAGESRRIPDCY